uniref:Uncharacterized protein n=1 Tax=Romanomermis culicivorax TaxID=13658 RepID=A0A915IXZ5_ROMCU
MFEKQFGCWIQ